MYIHPNRFVWTKDRCAEEVSLALAIDDDVGDMYRSRMRTLRHVQRLKYACDVSDACSSQIDDHSQSQDPTRLTENQEEDV